MVINQTMTHIEYAYRLLRYAYLLFKTYIFSHFRLDLLLLSLTVPRLCAVVVYSLISVHSQRLTAGGMVDKMPDL